MNELTRQQSVTGQKVYCILNNLQKDPIVRKSKAYLTAPLKHIQEIWIAFSARNNDLLVLGHHLPKHLYFGKYFSMMQREYNKKNTGFGALYTEATQPANNGQPFIGRADTAAKIEGISIVVVKQA